jgi:hypothetical protein
LAIPSSAAPKHHKTFQNHDESNLCFLAC